MTEEEKKSAYEAAKARISKAAVTLATAASALTPSLSAAQNSAENISPATAHTITADVKNPIEITDIKDNPSPTFELKFQMQKDRAEHNTELSSSIAITAQNLQSRLNTPVDMENSDNIKTYCDNSHIGDFNCTVTNFYLRPDASTTEKQPSFSSPKQTISRENILHLKPGDDNYVEGSLAAYDVKSKKVYIQDVPLTEQLAEDLKKAQDNAALEYIQGENTIVRNGVLYHETTHLNHFKYTGAADLTHPTDIAKFDRLTETTAVAAEYLNAALQYTFMKEQGMATIEFNGKQKPLESILEPYQGLKETITEKGFDIDNPQSVRNVVEASSKYWHKSRSELYAKQHKNAVDTGKKGANLFELTKSNDKEYQKIAQKATKQVYIGNNQNVDLSNCMDLLDTMTTEDAQKLLENEKIIRQSDLTYGKLNEVSKYLDSIGITDASAKSKYLSENFENITTRNGTYDETLKNIMLNTNTVNNGTILYADNITEKTNADGQRTITANTEQHMATLTATEKGEIKSDMQQDRAAHDNELNNQIASLTQPSSRQSNTAGNTLTLQMMKQQQAAR